MLPRDDMVDREGHRWITGLGHAAVFADVPALDPSLLEQAMDPYRPHLAVLAIDAIRAFECSKASK